MRTSPRLLAVLLVLGVLIGISFVFKYNAYLLYAIIGLAFYVLLKSLGREVALLYVIPILIVALFLVGHFFIIDFYNQDGLNPLNIHPLLLAWFVAYSLVFIEDLVTKNLILDKVFILSALVLASFLGITLLYRGMNGLSLALHNYLGPFSLFLMFYTKGKLSVRKVNLAVGILLGCAVLLGFLGIYEHIVQSNIVQSIYNLENPNWLDSTTRDGYRIKTLIGHPLQNALFFLFAMMIVHMRIENTKVKYPLLLLFVIDILLTGSRSIFLLSFLVLIYKKRIFKLEWQSFKQQVLAVVLAGVTVFVTFSSSLGNTFLSRLQGASDSTEARLLLFNYFINNLFSFRMMGLGGATENIVIIGQNNNPIFLENPWIIVFFDVGYFLLLYVLLLIAISRKTDYKLLIVIFIMAISGFNSFGVKSNVNYLLFYLLTYGYILGRQNNSFKNPQEVQI